MYMQWHNAMNDEIVLVKKLDELKDEHRELDREIRQMELTGADEMSIARKKKRKLQLRDQIATLEVEIYPDQPA